MKQKAQEDDEEDPMIGSKRREPFAENRHSILKQSQLMDNDLPGPADNFGDQDDGGFDPYALAEDGGSQGHDVEADLFVSQSAFNAHNSNAYDLNTQLQDEDNTEQIEAFINEGNDLVREDEANNNEGSSALSQGFAGDDYDNMVT